MGLFFVTPADNYGLMITINCIGALLIGPTPPLVWAMYTDTADYCEWKTGRRITALTFSSLQFAQKLGLAVGAGLTGIILGWFGFVANEAQTAESMMGIRFLFSIMPAALAIAGAMAIFFYKIDSNTITTMEKELAASRSSA